MNPNDVISLYATAAPAPVPKRKSAGLAWLLSMVLPGLGHFYCGLKLRGALVMGFSVAGMAAFWMSIAAQATGRGFDQNVLGAAFLVLPVLSGSSTPTSPRERSTGASTRRSLTTRGSRVCSTS
jgi:hypothetical protein